MVSVLAVRLLTSKLEEELKLQHTPMSTQSPTPTAAVSRYETVIGGELIIPRPYPCLTRFPYVY